MHYTLYTVHFSALYTAHCSALGGCTQCYWFCLGSAHCAVHTALISVMRTSTSNIPPHHVRFGQQSPVLWRKHNNLNYILLSKAIPTWTGYQWTGFWINCIWIERLCGYLIAHINMVGNRWQAGQGFGSIADGIAGGLRDWPDERIFNDPGSCDCSSCCCYRPPVVLAIQLLRCIDWHSWASISGLNQRITHLSRWGMSRASYSFQYPHKMVKSSLVKKMTK